MKFLRISIVLMLLLLVCTPAIFASNGEIIATVNGHEITLETFYKRLEEEAGPIILSQMILEELISQKQAETNIQVTEEDLSEVLLDIVSQLGGFEGLQYYLYQNGMTETELLEQLEWNILISKLAQSEVSVTDEEVIEWFNENKEYFAFDDEVEASHILVDSEEEALEILELLKSGNDFGELAQSKSQDPASAVRNGQLGYFSKGMMVEPFENIAFSLGINEFGIAKSDYGWHVIKVTDKQEARAATLEEAWDFAKITLIEYKSLDPYEYIDKLHSEADIQVFN